MDSYGNIWIPKESYGFLRIPKDSYGFLWIPMDSYGFLKLYLALLGNKSETTVCIYQAAS
jgi:hypothetical protein